MGSRKVTCGNGDLAQSSHHCLAPHPAPWATGCLVGHSAKMLARCDRAEVGEAPCSQSAGGTMY